MTQRSVAAPPAPDAPPDDAAASAPQVPATAKLTLAQALDIGMSQNPQVLQAQGQVESARYNSASQSAPMSGTIGFGGLNNTITNANFGNGANYAVVLPIETSGRFLYRGSQARAQLQGAQEDRRTTRLTVRQSVTNAYITLQVADEVLNSERTAYAAARHLADLTERQFQLGATKQSDAIRAHIAFVQEGQNLAQAVAGVLTARTNLNLALGRPADAAVDAADPLQEPPVSLSTASPAARTLSAATPSSTLRVLQQQALANRPEIKSSQAGERALHAATRLQEAQYLPDLYVGKDFSGSNQVLIGFSVPLPDFGSTYNAIRKARADEKVQREQLEQVRQQTLADVQTAYIALQQSLDNVVSYKTGILPQSESLLSRVTQGYSLGASTLLDVIDAQNTFRATRDSYYAALGSYHQTVAQLERAVGGPVADSILNGTEAGSRS